MTTVEQENADPARRFRKVLCGATLVMVGLSWPLWYDLDDFPAIPLVVGAPRLPASRTPATASALAFGLLAGMVLGRPRVPLLATAGLFTVLFLDDQLRMQPWAYQFVIMAALLATLPGRLALSCCRWYLIALYLHSGLSKLDASFVAEMGPVLIRVGGGIFGIAALSDRVDRVWVLILPAAEVALAVGLAFGATRRPAFLGVAVMHVALTLTLGPLGLGHSVIVQFWNLALLAEGSLLFWPRVCPVEAFGRVGPANGEIYARVATGLFFALPCLERVGLFDSWPSHALYASHSERSVIWIEATDPFRRLPEALRVACHREEGGSSWRLDLTAWCRAVRGVPAYPQARYANGVAEWIAARLGETPGAGDGVTVWHWSRAGIRTGKRAGREARNLPKIRRLGDTFFFPTHPTTRVR